MKVFMHLKDILKAQLAGNVLVDDSIDLKILETHIDKTDMDAVNLFEHVVALTKARQTFETLVSELNAKYNIQS